MIDRLAEDGRVKMAAKVAYQFHIDPVKVLDGTLFEFALRVAASEYVSEVEAAEMEQARAARNKSA